MKCTFSGHFLHDFYTGVTMADISGKPQPGDYPLCTSQFVGAATDGQIIELTCDPGIVGQYVWIQIPGPSEVLTLCEVEVYAGGEHMLYFKRLL